MARIALIRNADQVVVNTIDADESWTAPTGQTARVLGANENCGPGWSFNGSTFAPPADPPPQTDVDVLTDKVVALALVVLDAVNELRQWDADMKSLFAANSTLATIRTAVAALPNMPTRTRQQLINQVKSKMTDGSVGG